jgi:hypothetical protein
VHSVAGLASASLSLNLKPAWFIGVRVNGIYAPGDVGGLIGHLVLQCHTPLGAQPPGEESSAALSGLSGLRVEWCWGRNSSVMLTWYRSFTNDDDDRDIITMGYGFRFGG